MIDPRTKAWLDDMFIYGGANVYGPSQLKEEIDAAGEWANRFRANFEHVMKDRTLTAEEYEARTEISFDTDSEMFEYMGKLHQYLFNNGVHP
ncbi:hypothetical protein J7443_15075 [Tropicibacter sp. R15_0]|uniref:hypothetical protein n=1 Tax=Tropicibacter sp. R15_0 TaxID=2821101 RepID=UPI001AD9E3F8|nr:hypothetical protein [Tropicibacter sp. R15_0]MBO9466565.1 hypothetical protein [Tropicibacter sp. R15_0]